MASFIHDAGIMYQSIFVSTRMLGTEVLAGEAKTPLRQRSPMPTIIRHKIGCEGNSLMMIYSCDDGKLRQRHMPVRGSDAQVAAHALAENMKREFAFSQLFPSCRPILS